jgi:hypothetical protein
MQNSIKYIVKTDSGKVYILHIVDAFEFSSKQYIGLFLYHDEEYSHREIDLPLMRHRLLFETSINAIKDKVIEYTSGRNEKVTFEDSYTPLAA